jgi:hypothetical protein
VTVRTPESEDAADDEAQREVSKALAEALERAQRRHRRVVRALVLTGLLAALFALAFTWVWVIGPPRMPTPTPAPSPVPPTPVPPIWAPGVSLPSARSGLALVPEPGGTGAVFAIGGRSGSAVLSDTLRYNRATLDWEPRAAKPSAVAEVVGVALQGRIIVPGGCTAAGPALDVTEVYDVAADRWTTGPPLPAPVCGYALAELDGRIYLFGGRAGVDAPPARAVWSWQPGDAAWSDDPEDLPLPRSDAAAASVPAQAAIHLLGGRDGSGPQPNHWLFRPFGAEGQWVTEGGPPLPEGRAGLGAVFAEVPTAPTIYLIGGGWDRG